MCDGKGFYCLYNVLYGQSPCRFNGIQRLQVCFSFITVKNNKIMNEKDLIDFANWLWDIGRLKVKTQTPPFEDAEYWAKQYIKVRKLNLPVVSHC